MREDCSPPSEGKCALVLLYSQTALTGQINEYLSSHSNPSQNPLSRRGPVSSRFKAYEPDTRAAIVSLR